MTNIINLGIIASGVIAGYINLFGKNKNKDKNEKIALLIFLFFVILKILN